MTEKTLKFNNIKINKKEFHKSKQVIDLDSVDADKIVLSDRFRYKLVLSNRFRYNEVFISDRYKYFIGYQENERVKSLCIILPQMNGYIKYFENGGKNMSLLIKNSEVWEKYEEIWNAIKNKLNINFHSHHIYENKYLKVKVKEFDDNIKKKTFYVTIKQKKILTILALLS